MSAASPQSNYQTRLLNNNPSVDNDETQHFYANFILDVEVGRGRFAKVCLVKNKSNDEVHAAKIIRRWKSGKDTLENIMREIEIIERGRDNHHIVNMKQYYLGQTEVVLILENCFGDLYNHVHYLEGGLPEKFVVSATQQLLEAVKFLHSESFAHLDIKPENILLRRLPPECEIVLCDFGLAKYLDKLHPIRDLVGTPDYAAPEILNYNPIHLTTDLWSVGVVVYYLLTGESPFWAPTKEETFANVCGLRINFPNDLFEDVSPEAITFIQRLIKKDPRDRPSAAECLNDPWFTVSQPLKKDSSDTLPEPVTTKTQEPVEQHEQAAIRSPSVHDFVRSELDRSFGE